MNLKIGKGYLTYGANNIKTKAKETKDTFSGVMKSAAASKDTITITQKSIDQRIEDIRQKIDNTDFTGKSPEETYKEIILMYEEEFGYYDMNFSMYSNEKIHDKLAPAREASLKDKIPNYRCFNKEFYYRAMGYDKMTDKEKMAAIKERIGGETYTEKQSVILEMERAKLIEGIPAQRMIFSINRNAEKEFCRQVGIDYYADYCESRTMWQERFSEWALNIKVGWGDIFAMIEKEEYSPITEAEKQEMFNGLGENIDLLKGWNKI